jgi:cell division protein FtsB
MHGPELTFHAQVMNANILESNLSRTKYYTSHKLKKCNHTRYSFKFFACKLSIEIGSEGYVSLESKTKLRAQYQKHSQRRNVLHQEVLSGDHGDGVKMILNWLFVEAEPGKNAIRSEGYVSLESKTKLRAQYQKHSQRRNVLHQEVLSGDHGDGVKMILNWLFVEAEPGKNATGISTGAGTRLLLFTVCFSGQFCNRCLKNKTAYLYPFNHYP